MFFHLDPNAFSAYLLIKYHEKGPTCTCRLVRNIHSTTLIVSQRDRTVFIFLQIFFVSLDEPLSLDICVRRIIFFDTDLKTLASV